jgi:hypothetical protein
MLVEPNRRLHEGRDARRVRGGESDEFIGVGAQSLFGHERHREMIREPPHRRGIGSELFVQQLLQYGAGDTVHDDDAIGVTLDRAVDWTTESIK